MSKYLNIFVCAVFAFRYRHKANITWQLEHSKIIIRLNTTRILVRLQQLPATCKLLQLPLNWNSLDEVAEEGSGGTSKASAFATLIIDRMTWLRISASLDMIFSWMDFNASKHSSWKKIRHECLLNVFQCLKREAIYKSTSGNTFSLLRISAVKFPFSLFSSCSSITAWSTRFSGVCFLLIMRQSLWNER